MVTELIAAASNVPVIGAAILQVHCETEDAIQTRAAYRSDARRTGSNDRHHPVLEKALGQENNTLAHSLRVITDIDALYLGGITVSNDGHLVGSTP